MNKLIFCISCLLGTIAISHAQVYSYKDANGRTIYTDNPPKGKAARVIDLDKQAPINKLETNSDAVSPNRTIRLSPKQQRINYSLLRIMIPEPGVTLLNTGGNLMVSLKSEPELAPGHRYQVLIDGEVKAESTGSPVLNLTEVYRGEHKLVAEIVDENNKVIERTPMQPIYIKQTTLADKKRIHPCKLKDYGVRPECPLKDKPPSESLLRKITNKAGLTKKCRPEDYGVRKDCPKKKTN